MRELFDEGMTLDAAARIVGLQDELDTARARIDELEAQHGVLRSRNETNYSLDRRIV